MFHSTRSFAALSAALAALLAWLLPTTARAEGRPLESPYFVHPEPATAERGREWAPEPEPNEPASLLRFSVGPALLVRPTNPGLLTALDIGRRAVGVRLSAAFLRAESDRGLASYGAELWVDLGHRSLLHPLLGAGVGWLHGTELGPRRNAGAGVLRGGLEYELPLEEADARVGLTCMGLVPAIASDRTAPWLVGGVTIGAGF
jgi:hypothetical protein